MGELLKALGLPAPKATVSAGSAAVASDAEDRYRAARAAAQADLDAAAAVMAAPDALTAEAASRYTDASGAVDESTAHGFWAQAQARLVTLQAEARSAVAAEADRVAYETDRAALKARPDYAQARAMVHESGLPDAVAKPYEAAAAVVAGMAQQKRWKDATAALPAIAATIPGILKVGAAGKVYYDAYAAAAADIARGRIAFFDPAALVDDLAGERSTWSDADSKRVDLVRAQNWVQAKQAVEPERRAAVTLADALAAVRADQPPFDAAFAGLRNLDLAHDAALHGPAGMRRVEGAAFLARYETMNDARNRGRFAEALAAVTPLQPAIDAVLAANTADLDARLGFENARNALGDLSSSRALVAAPAPALVAECTAWRAADGAVDAAARAGDWLAATAAVTILAAADRNLATARGAFNASAGAAGSAAVTQQLLALKPRIALAAEATQPVHVEALQTSVRSLVATIGSAIQSKDVAGAQATLAKLEPALAAMEKAKADDAAFRIRFAAARDGAVQKARSLALQPAQLAADRDEALARSEAAIAALADAGSLVAAARRVDAWLAEAKAWAGSKAAFDALTSSKPDEAALKKLASAPGGAAVMDAIVARLPPETSQRVMSAALKARFGFRVRSLDKSNDDAANMAGVKAVDASQPNSSLQKIYEVLSKTPVSVKGKVTDVIDFKQDADGAMYDNNKKIYMYCGRPDDATAGQQEFSVEGAIVAEGDEVSGECKPVDTKAVPYFDFALLHEAGHAEDDAAGFMSKHFGAANVAFGGWTVDSTPGAAAKAAAAHFRYDLSYVRAMLAAAKSAPPKIKPPPPKGRTAQDWEASRLEAAEWCRVVRVDQSLWNDASLAKSVAIDGRVYQEAYPNYWVSYAYAARASGITGYQFRSHMEWFAELYAAYFSGKLKPEHPSAAWLSKFKTPQPA